MTTAKRKQMMKVWRLRWWRKQRDKFYNLGLRSDGKARLTNRAPVTASERLRRLRLSRKIRRDRFIAKRHAAGLSARGNPLREKLMTPLEKLFAEIHELT
jgi:hypothetical protein